MNKKEKLQGTATEVLNRAISIATKNAESAYEDCKRVKRNNEQILGVLVRKVFKQYNFCPVAEINLVHSVESTTVKVSQGQEHYTTDFEISHRLQHRQLGETKEWEYYMERVGVSWSSSRIDDVTSDDRFYGDYIMVSAIIAKALQENLEFRNSFIECATAYHKADMIASNIGWYMREIREELKRREASTEDSRIASMFLTGNFPGPWVNFEYAPLERRDGRYSERFHRLSIAKETPKFFVCEASNYYWDGQGYRESNKELKIKKDEFVKTVRYTVHKNEAMRRVAEAAENGAIFFTKSRWHLYTADRLWVDIEGEFKVIGIEGDDYKKMVTVVVNCKETKHVDTEVKIELTTLFEKVTTSYDAETIKGCVDLLLSKI